MTEYQAAGLFLFATAALGVFCFGVWVLAEILNGLKGIRNVLQYQADLEHQRTLVQCRIATEIAKEKA